MILVTGDCHGDYRRFSSKSFPDQKQLTKDDYIIICGDFGFWEDCGEQRWWLKWLSDKPFTTLWVDGNHENFDLLGTCPVSRWHGGLVQQIAPSVLHLMRGQIYEIEGSTFFTFGGAQSHDAICTLNREDPDFRKKKEKLRRLGLPYRINHQSWWKEELPDDREMQEGISNLKKHHYKVDFIITHCAPTSLQHKIMRGTRKANVLTEYLEEEVLQKTEYDLWMFGHYHGEGWAGEKEILLYENIFRLI